MRTASSRRSSKAEEELDAEPSSDDDNAAGRRLGVDPRHRRSVRHPWGKRRIHEKPDAGQIAACRPWLRAELAAVRPQVIVVLGATAAATVLGRSFRVTKQRGEPLDWADYAADSPLVAADGAPVDDAAVVATVHPSAVLRSRDRATAYTAFVADLGVVARLLS